MNLSSMIVFQIDVDSIAFDPAKCNAPVSAADRIAAFFRGQRVHESGIPAKFISSGREASSSARRMLAIRRVFCTLIRRPSPVAKNRSRALSRNERIISHL